MGDFQQLLEHLRCSGEAFRQYQVPDQYPAKSEAFGIRFQPPHLTNHFPDGRPVVPCIIRDLGKGPGRFVRPVFHVRQINVHDPFQALQQLEGNIPVGVIDDRQPQTPGDGQFQGLQNKRPMGRGGYQVQVVAAALLQIQENVRQGDRRNFLPQTFLTDLMVLTVQAAESATGKENRTGPPFARQRRFLPEMGQGLGHPGLTPLLAEPGLPGQTVHPTFPGAQPAGGQEVPGLFYPFRKGPGFPEAQIRWFHLVTPCII